MNTYPAPYWTLRNPTTTNTSELKAGLGLLKRTRQTLTTRGKCYGFSVGEKQSYEAEAVSQTYTSHPGLLPPSPTSLILPIRGHTSIILLSEVTLGGT